MTMCAAPLVAVAARWVALHQCAAALFSPRAVYDPSVFGSRPLMLGAAIASLSYIGFDAMWLQLAVELLNFGAFAGVILVNLRVIRHYLVRRCERASLGALTNLIFPLSGAVVCSCVWLNPSWKVRLPDFLRLGGWTVYLAVLTRCFRVAPCALHSLTEAN